ncbi:MAG: TetR/AcrR family transcriptional regulator [Pseudomonadales bacterium]
MAKTARELAKTQRRDDILGAARQLMRDGGDLSMRTLAERAGVSIATPYNLFGSKQSILLAILNADLKSYEDAVGQLRADEIDVLFESTGLMTSLLGQDPEFYRNMISAASRDGPEFRHMVNGPRYIVWKKLLRQATAAGLLADHVDPDAFAIASSQLLVANVLEWAQGALTLQEMTARNHYGLALTLLAIATGRSRPQLEAHLRDAERTLQQLWRRALSKRLRDGELNAEDRELLADQLKHLHTDDQLETTQ